MVAVLLYRIVIIVAGALYPAYSSFKAVRRRSHKEYTKWMMYWIVFALFQSAETFLDTFISWLPLYYEIKILFVLWLVLPITEGSKQLYRIVVHPYLLKYEEQIDKHLAKIGQSSFRAVRRFSQAGLSKAATTVLSSAIKGQAVLAETLLRTQEEEATQNEGTDQTDGRSSSSPPPPQARVSTSSTDLEPFEVFDEGSEDVYMSVQQGTGFEPVVFQNSAAKSGSLLSIGDQLVSDGTDNKKPY